MFLTNRSTKIIKDTQLNSFQICKLHMVKNSSKYMCDFWFGKKLSVTILFGFKTNYQKIDSAEKINQPEKIRDGPAWGQMGRAEADQPVENLPVLGKNQKTDSGARWSVERSKASRVHALDRRSTARRRPRRPHRRRPKYAAVSAPSAAARRRACRRGLGASP